MNAEYRPLSNRDYHAEEEHESNSTLSKFVGDRRSYYMQRVKRVLPQKVSTAAMDEGTAVHALTYGSFEEDCFVLPPGPYQSNAAKAAKGKAILDNPGKVALSTDQYEHCQAVARAVREHEAYSFLTHPDAQTEFSVFFEHEGVKLKSRFDTVQLHNGDVYDLKTLTRHHSKSLEEHWAAQLYERNYYRQAALYMLAAEKYTGHKGRHFHVVVLCDEGLPHEVFVLPTGELTLAKGLHDLNQILYSLKQCRECDEFDPGGPHWNNPLPLVIELPEWALRRELVL